MARPLWPPGTRTTAASPSCGRMAVLPMIRWSYWCQIHALLARSGQLDDQRQPALGRHLERRGGEARRAHVLDGDDRVGRHQLEASLEQQLLDERIADLHRRPLALAVLVELRRGHGRAVDAVAAGL